MTTEVFARKASGLTREASGFDAFALGFMNNAIGYFYCHLLRNTSRINAEERGELYLQFQNTSPLYRKCRKLCR